MSKRIQSPKSHSLWLNLYKIPEMTVVAKIEKLTSHCRGFRRVREWGGTGVITWRQQEESYVVRSEPSLACVDVTIV